MVFARQRGSPSTSTSWAIIERQIQVQGAEGRASLWPPKELHALNTLAQELTDLYGTAARLDQPQATLWNQVAREAEAAEHNMDAILALVAEATEARV